MTWFDRIVIGVIGGGVAFVLWLIQRWMTKAKEGEAIDRLTKKLDSLDKLKEYGLPKDSVVKSIMKDIVTIGKPITQQGLEQKDTSHIYEAMRVAAENDDTRIISEEEIATLEEERADLWDHLIATHMRYGGVIETLGRSGIDTNELMDTLFITNLAILSRSVAAGLAAKVRRKGIVLGQHGTAVEALSLDEMQETMEGLTLDEVEDSQERSTLQGFKDHTLARIEEIRLARAELEAKE